MMVVQGATEGEVEEREMFWNDLDRVVDKVDKRYRLCLLGDLNGWAGDRLRVGITIGFEVPGRNDGKMVIDFVLNQRYL